MENSFEKIQKSDPSKSQLTGQALDLASQGVEERFPMQRNGNPMYPEVYIDKNTGERFVKIKRMPQKQMFVSLLAKGAINTSDIIEKDGEYFSHEQNAETVESLGEDYFPEMKADLFILERVFQDRDHLYYPVGSGKRDDTNEYLGAVSKNTFKEHANVLADDINKKVNYFDFTDAFWSPYSSREGKERDESGFERKLQDITDEKVLEVLKRKSHYFLDHVFTDYDSSNPDHPAFPAIVKKSGVNFEGTEEEQKEIFGFMQKRFQKMYNISSKKLIELKNENKG